MTTDNIIERLEIALQRMREEGNDKDEYGQPCFYYERLKAKKEAIENGSSYTSYNVAPFLIAYVGSHIPDINMGMDNKTIKGRGNKEEATINAVNNYYQYKISDIYK